VSIVKIATIKTLDRVSIVTNNPNPTVSGLSVKSYSGTASIKKAFTLKVKAVLASILQKSASERTASEKTLFETFSSQLTINVLFLSNFILAFLCILSFFYPF
jgi:hypothetical protein